MSTLRLATWPLEKIAEKAGAQLHGWRDGRVSGVSTDTRSIAPGALFVALRGERFDGHRFVESAFERGASAALVDAAWWGDYADPDGAQMFFVVDDTLNALARLGHALWQEATAEGLHTVAVTGSNGKTTTKELLSALWSTRGKVWATPGNLNNHIGVPLTLCALPVDCDHLICEMGANHIGEIAHLVRLAPGSARVITSIGSAHLEGFGSMEGIRRGKSEIFEHSDADSHAVFPFSEKDELVLEGFSGTRWTFGHQEGARVRVVSLRERAPGEPSGMTVGLEVDSRELTLSLPLLGMHNATNLAAALATLAANGVELDESLLNEALARLVLPGGRFRQLVVQGVHILDDAYNANPSSVRASVEAFERWAAARDCQGRYAVLGEMLELGEGAAGAHAELARWVALRPSIDGLAFVGGFSELMARSALEVRSELDVCAFSSITRELTDWVGARQGSAVLLKGSRGGRLETIVDALTNDPASGSPGPNSSEA
ncbi:UDP-N-acetylmuramoyl-tripeptide--D-alanyl-D-alanine ligase [Lujinxingia sediminis]|uniref:UDP-N-acetylmuramoyl-tripeptide--D-alanyl-D-alanine ligase n=1 Tax=Lujinxingia sediminis TaxID=2480984 RepID=A0ABY0CXK0_9DELT|nr:UDP-N-acetylmuramoyl-tripeptide--D-alanyl-D-alanine ligase [Lujinxingia sediminis]RVU48618.1 UDP-N-acetylmuramoyl-tripeptide--D-alanyl-D-alanine ligase [Lujinxingia sediminis]